MCEQVFFAGKLDTIYGHCKRFGVYESTVRRRLDRGYTLADAIHEEPRRGSSNLITAFGMTQTRKEWAAVYGVTANVITVRLRRGWKPERAVSEPIRGKPLWAFGRTQSLAAWSRETGINRTTIYRRIHHYGIPPEVALTTPVQGSK